MTENKETQSKSIFQSFDDIVFEKRNKAYGAYDLRKKYKRNVVVAFWVSFFIIGSVVAVPLIDAYNNKDKQTKKREKKVVAEMARIKNKEEVAPPPPPPPPVQEIETQVKVAAPEVVEEVKEDTPELGLAEDLVAAPPTEAPLDLNAGVVEEKAPEIVVEEKIFQRVEQSATFQGGTLNDFRNWVGSNLVYPPEALELGSSGTVVVQFCVNSAGKTCDVTFMKSSGFPYLDNEARRVILSSPNWSPGRQGGTPVKQQFVLPVTFQLAQQ